MADQTPPGLYGAPAAFVPIASLEIALPFANLPTATARPWVLGDIRTPHAADGFLFQNQEDLAHDINTFLD